LEVDKLEKTTLETSGEDVKTTLQTSEEDAKMTIKTSNIEQENAEKIEFYDAEKIEKNTLVSGGEDEFASLKDRILARFNKIQIVSLYSFRVWFYIIPTRSSVAFASFPLVRV
jgi:hypothetical protein